MINKRRSPRKASLERCRVELYASAKGPFESRVVNYSDTGLMIEMDHPLTKGEPVKILFRPGDETARRIGENYCVGMVRWCAPQDGPVFEQVRGGPGNGASLGPQESPQGGLNRPVPEREGRNFKRPSFGLSFF